MVVDLGNENVSAVSTSSAGAWVLSTPVQSHRVRLVPELRLERRVRNRVQLIKIQRSTSRVVAVSPKIIGVLDYGVASLDSPAEKVGTGSG